VGHLVADPIGDGDLVHRSLQVVAMAGGASKSTNPLEVVRNAAWYMPSVTQ
jgi:hypothetical protein